MSIITDELQHSVIIDRQEYEIETDFRAYIKYEQLMNNPYIDNKQKSNMAIQLIQDFKPENENQINEAITQIVFFFIGYRIELDGEEEQENLTEEEIRPTYDFEIDAEFITAAFQQAYSIDLTVEYLHWHRFLALFKGLPEETMLKKIIGFRTAKENPKLGDSENEEIRRMHKIWDLPIPEGIRIEHEKEVEKWK